MKNYTPLGVTLRPATIAQIEKLADANRESRTCYLRQLIKTAVSNADRAPTPDISRLLIQQEYQTLLLHEIVRQRNPEGATKLAQAAEDLAKKHHGT